MLKNKYHTMLIISIVSSFLLLLSIAYFMFFNSEKVVYVDNIELFEAFNMTIEAKKEGEAGLNDITNERDSLLVLATKSNATAVEKERLKSEVIKREHLLENFKSKFSEIQSENIWKRLKSYLNDYAKKNNCIVILSDPQGENIINADTKTNVTKDLVLYINNRYEGNE